MCLIFCKSVIDGEAGAAEQNCAVFAGGVFGIEQFAEADINSSVIGDRDDFITVERSITAADIDFFDFGPCFIVERVVNSIVAFSAVGIIGVDALDFKRFDCCGSGNFDGQVVAVSADIFVFGMEIKSCSVEFEFRRGFGGSSERPFFGEAVAFCGECGVVYFDIGGKDGGTDAEHCESENFSD